MPRPTAGGETVSLQKVKEVVSILGSDLRKELERRFDGVISVPDSTQKTFLQSWKRPLIQPVTEDQAVGIAVGMRLAGENYLVSVQNSGYFAAMNSIRTLVTNSRLPIWMMIGMYGRNTKRAIGLHHSLAIRRIYDALELMESRGMRIDDYEDLDRLQTIEEHPGLNVILLGAPTS